MPSYMYILECADGSFYTGSTRNIERRLWQHQNGEGANYTKKRLPVKLIYAEPYDRVEDAFRREKQVQGWSRRKKLALIEGNYDRLIAFSRNYTQHDDPASTSSACGETATQPTPELVTEPAPEPVEGKGGTKGVKGEVLDDPASTGSACGGGFG